MSSSSDLAFNKQKPRRWKEKNHYERHYCKLCNAWMASDRQSILHHERGSRHQHNLRQAEIAKQQATEQQEKEQSLVQASLTAMEAAAVASIQNDYGLLFAGTAGGNPAASLTSAVSSLSTPTPQLSASSVRVHSGNNVEQQQGTKNDWVERKRAREEAKRKADEGDDSNKRKKPTIQPDEGWYTDSERTWLEGVVFGDILEAEMPIQLWKGHASATANEKRIGSAWQDAIVAAVRRQPSSIQHADRLVLDISYLADGADEETLEKSISLNDVRIRLGNPMDSRIPPTIDQARLLAMGGEEIEVQDASDRQRVVDEATGFSSWTTVKVTRTTSLLEQKQKREELRAENERKKKASVEAEKRRLEEEAHAPDSALGAYDVWGKQGGGYKGVNIQRDTDVEASDVVKNLAEGPVSFKKKPGKKRNKMKNRRTTTSDD